MAQSIRTRLRQMQETGNLIRKVVAAKGGGTTVRKVTSRHLNSSLA